MIIQKLKNTGTIYINLYIIFRVKLNDTIKDFVFDCLLLQPITFSLIVKRNLSSAWYTDHPDFDIVAKFDSIKV